MAQLTVTAVSRSGIDSSLSSVSSGGDYFVNTGCEFISVAVAAGAPTITISTPKTVDGLAVADRTVACTSGCVKFIGPFPTGTYNSGSVVAISYDVHSNITAGVFQLTNV